MNELSEEFEALQPKREENWPKYLWRASSLGYCYRRQMLAAKRIKLPMPTGLPCLFSVHSGAHEAVQQWFADNYPDAILEDEEICDNPDLKITGHPDVILPTQNVVVEIKTLNSWYLKKILSGDAEMYWSQQINYYLHQLNNSTIGGCPAESKACGESIPTLDSLKQEPQAQGETLGYSFLVDDSGNKHAIECERDDTFMETISTLNVSWETNILPPPCWECDGHKNDEKCPIRHICTEPIDSVSGFCDVVKEELS